VSEEQSGIGRNLLFRHFSSHVIDRYLYTELRRLQHEHWFATMLSRYPMVFSLNDAATVVSIAHLSSLSLSYSQGLLGSSILYHFRQLGRRMGHLEKRPRAVSNGHQSPKRHH
jgi:hypothetical protein